MAQDFESTGTQITNSETTLLTADSDDAVIGLRLTNTTASSVELIQGGAKIVLQSGDVLYGLASAATSVDAWLSRVDTIST